MNDESFNHDLLQVLRAEAGEEASVSLRSRLASIADEAPVGRRLWFSPPMGLSVALVSVVAVLVLAFLLMQRDNVGPGPSQSPEPTPTAAQSGTPAPSAEPTPTREPTPTPTPALTTWTGIAWADPFAPFPYRQPVYVGQEGTSTTLNTILPWNGGFLAAGSISHGFQCEEAAFFRSDDGASWTVTQTFPSGDQFVFSMCPDHLGATSSGLLAIGQGRIWRSTDGLAWTQVPSPSWDALWPDPGVPQLLNVAFGPAGVVVIGMDPDTRESIVVESVDGSTWQTVSLPAEETPIARDVAAFAGGFVIVGRDGQPDADPTTLAGNVVPGVGRAAAWTSRDGVDWTESTVEADRVKGGAMTQVLVGSAGLFAVGINTDSALYPGTDYAAGDVVSAWVSEDGTSWRLAGALGANLPPMGLLAFDGTTIVGLGLHQPWVGQDPSAWATLDGLHWTQLAVSGPVLDVSYLVLEQQLLANPPDTALWVLPDGLLALGAGDGVPVNEPYATQWFRFASAATR